MTRRMLILPVLALVLVAGYAGFRMGQPLTETDIINLYAAEYLRGAGDGATATDCAAVPGEGVVHMIITCTPPAGPNWVFQVGTRGEFIAGQELERPEA